MEISGEHSDASSQSLEQAAQERERTYATRQAEGSPFYVGRWFDIEYSTTNPHGFIIQTEHVARRREGVENFPTHRIHHANKTYAKKTELRGENFRPKVAIRSVQHIVTIDPETGETHDRLILNPIIPATYPTYLEFGNIQDREMSEQIANIAGVAMMLVTADGKIIVQKRGKNRTYGDKTESDKRRGIPGASAAGTLDAQFYSREEIAEARERGIDLRGMIKPVDNDYINRGILKELKEEDGIDPAEVTFTTAGYVTDNINPHVEFCNIGKTTLTADEVRDRANKNHEERGEEGFDFAERVMVLTPEELEKILTQVHVPIPPTHAAAMTLTLQSIWLQNGMSQENVDARMEKLQEQMQENNRTINRLVRQFYAAHPEVLERNRQLYSNVNEYGYDPRVFGIDQGIPVLDDDLERVGIQI